MNAALAEAARFEVAWREQKLPLLVANGELAAEQAQVDYQAWCIIAAWLAGGHFITIEQGGADGTTRVGWPQADEAARRAANTLLRHASNTKDPAKAAKLWPRQAAVAAIARAVSLRRQSIDDLNAHFTARRQAQAKAA